MSNVTENPSRDTMLRAARAVGAVVGYGGLAAFLCLTSVQVYRWLRDGEWTHFGVNEGLRFGLALAHVNDGDTGLLAALAQWLDTPATWLGLHKVLDMVPASLALFAFSILGNSLFIYCRERIEEREPAQAGSGEAKQPL